MTTKAELAKLFNIAKDTNRIAGFGGNARVAIDPSRQNKNIVVTAELADPKTHQRTGKQLFLALHPLDALSLARAIQAAALELGVKEPPGEVVLQENAHKKTH